MWVEGGSLVIRLSGSSQSCCDVVPSNTCLQAFKGQRQIAAYHQHNIIWHNIIMAAKVMLPDAISQREHACIKQSWSKPGTLWNASTDSGCRTLKGTSHNLINRICYVGIYDGSRLVQWRALKPDKRSLGWPLVLSWPVKEGELGGFSSNCCFKLRFKHFKACWWTGCSIDVWQGRFCFNLSARQDVKSQLSLTWWCL